MILLCYKQLYIAKSRGKTIKHLEIYTNNYQSYWPIFVFRGESQGINISPYMWGFAYVVLIPGNVCLIANILIIEDWMQLLLEVVDSLNQKS